MTNLFLNYNAQTYTVTVNTYRNIGYFNTDVAGFIADIAMGVHSCCNLEGALDAVRDGSVWAGTNATPAILEMIDEAICEFHYYNN
jgi:hypothetical protein